MFHSYFERKNDKGLTFNIIYFRLEIQLNLPIADIPNSGHALNSGQII